MKKQIFLMMLLALTETMLAQIVSTNSELETAINNAQPGTIITLADKVWEDVDIKIDNNGTIANPIVITAQTPGSVFIEGNSHVELKGSFIVLTGLIFQNASSLTDNGDDIITLITLNACDDCVVTNIKIDNYNGSSSQSEFIYYWIFINGERNEISYNSFLDKNGLGTIIRDRRYETNETHTKIHHNYFGGRTPVGGVVNQFNEQDAITIGHSSTSLSNSFSEVYENYFENFFGEIEMISNKSGGNKYYNNTFRNYAGTLTLRHGNDCEVYGNFFFAENNPFSGGIRVMGEGHKIYNNYIQGVNSISANGSLSKGTGGINITNGRENTEINGYYQVKDAIITNNTFIDCDYGVRVGTQVQSDLFEAPSNVQISNNIFLNTTLNAYQEVTAPINDSKAKANISENGNWDLSNGNNQNIIVNSGLLIEGNNFYTVPSGSAAINYGVGSFPFLTNDILGGTRLDFDAGAEEFGAMGTKLPFTINNVGETIGFGAQPYDDSEERLLTSVDELVFFRSGGTKTINIISNINWEITSSDNSWLTIDVNSGQGNTSVSISTIENTTGNNKTGNITVSQVGGTLTQVISIKQTTLDFEENLMTSVDKLRFFKNDQSKIFEIDSNIDWEITNTGNSWLSVNENSGQGNAAILVSVIENTANDRTASITVSQVGGELTQVISVTQSASEFDPSTDAIEVIPVAVTGVGTQIPNNPENVLDNLDFTRWTGNSGSGDAYLTFDLGCEQFVTGVRIKFLDGNERSSSFRILTSNDNIVFNEVTGVLTSSGTTLDYEQFNFDFPFLNIEYFRIEGLGNSGPAPNNVFNSYVEVEIIGDPIFCNTTLDVEGEGLGSIIVYPIPVTQGRLILKSSKIEVKSVKIYSITGKLLNTYDYNASNNNLELNVSNLSTGLYFLKINNEITQRFLVN